MANSTLEAIRTKVRYLGRVPSPLQYTDAQIDEYINTFVQFDFPEHIRLSSLRTTFTFYTQPNVDVYETNQNPANDFYNFINRYITVHSPVYVAGYQSYFTSSRQEFFGWYPITNSIQSIGVTGDDVTANFSGTLSNVPVLRNNVLFSSIDLNGDGLELHDDGLGTLSGNGSGTIDYVTGAFTLNFVFAPGSGQAINSQTVPYVAALPQAVLFYDNKFTLRPVPDQAYRVNLEAYVRPTELLETNQSPELQEWWQYIAYGAAKKLLEDRLDTETVQSIMPEFKMQERLILRRTLVQQSNERSATIYTSSYGSGYGWNQGWGFF